MPLHEAHSDNFLSAFLARRSLVRPHASLHQCWHEPVQVHLPGYRGSIVGLCEAQTCRELAKGWEAMIVAPVVV